MAIPTSPDEPCRGTKLSSTFERQCSFFTADLDMANELLRKGNGCLESEQKASDNKKKEGKKCRLHNKEEKEPVTSCYLTFVSLQMPTACGVAAFHIRESWIILESQVRMAAWKSRTRQHGKCVYVLCKHTTTQQPNDCPAKRLRETFPHAHCALGWRFIYV